MSDVVAYGSSEREDSGPLGLAAESIVVRQEIGGEKAGGWRQIPRVYNRNLIKAVHDEQQQAKRRQSQATVADFGGEDYLEPPQDLNALTSLLLESVDFFAVVDQFATDVAGLGWDLVDAERPGEPPAVPEAGDVERGADANALALQQQREAKAYLETLAEDFTGKKIPLSELFRIVDMDYESTGNGYVEVSRAQEQQGQPSKINGLYHVPSRLVRRRRPGEDGEPRGFVQIDDQGRLVTIFRDWRSDPNRPDSRFTPAEIRGLKAPHLQEALRESQSTGAPLPLKNELADFKRYHSASPYYGIPQVTAALSAVYGNIYSDARNLRWFINRSVPDWLVSVMADNATFRDPNRAELVNQFLAAIKEHMTHLIQGEDHRTLILRIPKDLVEIKWEKLGSEPKDQDFEVYQTRNRDVVIRAYRMLPHRIGIIETASLGSGTGESQDETYKRAQIDPRQNMYEDFMNQVLDELGYLRLRFKFREIDILDEQREMGMYSQATASKVMTLNEGRRWLSRIVKDQDFPDYEEEEANVPVFLLEMQAGGPLIFPPGMGTVEPFAPSTAETGMLPQYRMRRALAAPHVDEGFVNISRRVREGMRGAVEKHRERLGMAGRHKGQGNGGATDVQETTDAALSPGSEMGTVA